MRPLLFILLFSVPPILNAAAAQLTYYIYPNSPPTQQRHVFYPVRTNCVQNCAPQNRYRWNYRPTGLSRPLIPVSMGSRPLSSSTTMITSGSAATVGTTLTTSAPYIAASTSSSSSSTTTTQETTTPILTTAEETPAATTSTSSAPSTSTESPSVLESLVRSILSVSGQPSPAPTTERAPPPPPPSPEDKEEAENQMSTTVFMRPEKKEPQETTMTTETAYTASTNTTATTTTATTSTSTSKQSASHNSSVSGTPIPATERERHFNPCRSGKPLMNAYDVPVACNYLVRPNGGCPIDYFCHTGATFATTACCPNLTPADRCAQARETGEGSDLIARWFFDSASKQCKRFLYKGLLGTANNFVTKAECADVCEQEHILDATNPCKYGQPAKNKMLRRLNCSAGEDENLQNQCPSGYYCHVGAGLDTTACCQSSGLSEPCHLALSVGQGRALLRRFYYNTMTKRCVDFTYKGTRGNENNFLTRKACEQRCAKSDDPCPVLDSSDGVLRPTCTVDGNECGLHEWCHIGHSPKTSVCCPGAVVDICGLPIVEGEGGRNLTRWAADPSDPPCRRQCKQFQYGGSKGNQNSFLTKARCEKACKRECRSPCGQGELLLDRTGAARQCSPTSPCPNTHWCHVGATSETTVCCSASSSPCQLPLLEGYGDARLTRWHFNAFARKCQSFVYRGLGGNQNMFLTLDDCRTVCPAYENPCGSGEPVLVDGMPKLCSPSARCPATHFCHLGSPDQPQYCCPKNGSPCEQDVSLGVGNLELARAYYDRETRRCREFMYKGARGNANNFLSIEDCELVCPVWPNPCETGEPLFTKAGEPLVCGGETECASGYWCHVGGSPTTTTCCPGTRRPCDLPLAVGQGEERLERWFFDGSIQMCRAFVYHGQKGNSNNFLTADACRKSCNELNPCAGGDPLVDSAGERVLCTGGQNVDSCPRSHFCHVGSSALTTLCCPRISNVESCDQPVVKGESGEQLPRWYFDAIMNRCLPFTYGGIKGNQNNFISQQTCNRQCPEHRAYCPHGLPLLEPSGEIASCGIDRACPNGHICHISAQHNVSVCCQDPADFCEEPRESGACTNFETRYGYDPQLDRCVPFQWGGCDGTLNNFRTLQRCTEICCKEYKL